MLPPFKEAPLRLALVWRCLALLAPSFLISRIRSESSIIDRERPTSYLDGLKGLASWFVFNTHLAPLLSQSMGAGWGHDQGHSFLQLPFIHFIHAGGFPIHLFFVINGFIISCSAVRAMDTTTLDEGAMMRKLSTTIFQRPFRLFLPSMASTLVSFLLIRLNLFYLVNSMKDDAIIKGWPVLDAWPSKSGSFAQQLGDVLYQNVKMTRILERNEGVDYPNVYNPVLWTTPVQFQGTLLLSIAHAAAYYVPPQPRLLIVSCLVAGSLAAGQFIMLSFILGWLLAELIPMAAESNERDNLEKPGWGFSVCNTCWVFIFALALYLASYPRFEPENTTGFKSLYAITPPSLGVTSDLWHSVAAALTVLSVQKLSALSRFLSKPMFRYLGRISFGLYLTHLWSTQLAGTLIYTATWHVWKRTDAVTEAIGFCLAYTLTLATNLWVAEVWAKTMEAQCSRIALSLKDVMMKRLQATTTT